MLLAELYSVRVSKTVQEVVERDSRRYETSGAADLDRVELEGQQGDVRRTTPMLRPISAHRHSGPLWHSQGLAQTPGQETPTAG